MTKSEKATFTLLNALSEIAHGFDEPTKEDADKMQDIALKALDKFDEFIEGKFE